MVERSEFHGTVGRTFAGGEPWWPPRAEAPEGAPNVKGDMHFTDTIEKMELAYDDWKAGHYSRDPFQDMMIPTLIDPTMTPPGDTAWGWSATPPCGTTC